MWFGVLGPLTVVGDDGANVQFDGPRQSKVLAMLLLNANTLVPLDSLRTAMWDAGDEPATAVRQVQDAVSGLRRHLGAGGAASARIERNGRAFRLNLDAESLDLLAFEDHLRRSRQMLLAGERSGALRAMRDALGCWRGPALAGLRGDVLASAAERLEARRFATQLQAIELELELGNDVADECVALLAEHPLDERLAQQAMLALRRGGRRSEAVAVYDNLRRRLVDELGMEPGSEIVRLYHQISESDAEPGATASDTAVGSENATAGAPNPPNQLPADTRSFTGREEELGQVLALAERVASGDGGAVVISAIDGMAGIGKTALAIHAAHSLKARFPDGRLFVDLRGYDPQAEPMSSVDALGYLLRALGVSLQKMPAGENERSAALRARLADRRCLLILDNAASTAQVLPLLPGSSGCLVVITSRRKLFGLDDAHILNLDVVPAQDAIALLHRVAGPGRIAEGHPLLSELAELCGRIPLAIRITAARLKFRRTLTVDELVEQLRDEHTRLAALADEDRSLVAAFEASFATLASQQQRLFRLLGVVPGQDFDDYAAASLCGTDRRTARILLDSLLDHNLLSQHQPYRYRFHDLVRDYARSLLAELPADVAEDARHRLFDYYEHTAHMADTSVTPGEFSFAGTSVPPPSAAPSFKTSEGRLEWLRAERDNLVAAIDYARGHGNGERVVGLTAGLQYVLHVDGPWNVAAEMHETAAELARAQGADVAEADACGRAADLLVRLGNYKRAEEMHGRALRLYEKADELLGQEQVLRALSRLHGELAEFPEAVQRITDALAIARRLGDRRDEAQCLYTLGNINEILDPVTSIQNYLEALAIFEDVGRPLNIAQTLFALGNGCVKLGRFPEAVSYFDRARPAVEMADHRWPLALIFRGRGTALLAMGELEEARESFGRALALFDEFGDPLFAAHARFSLGLVRQAEQEHGDAQRIFDEALAAIRTVGRPESEAEVLVAAGRSRRHLGQLAAARSDCREALALFEKAAHRSGQAWTLIEIGALAAQTGAAAEALDKFRSAVNLAHSVGAAHCEATALDHLADCLDSLGDRSGALAALAAAVGLYRQCGVREAASAAQRLDGWSGATDGEVRSERMGEDG